MPQVCVPDIDDLLANQDFLTTEHPMTWLRQKLIVNDQQIQQVLKAQLGLTFQIFVYLINKKCLS